ncbi:nSTAND1 domain-containing NTPase, partial [Candidatus Marithrix sp. Canyon 246]
MNDYPYPGLRPFERDETYIFFGRDEHTDQLIEKLGNSHFLAVVGPSGCGKSSLVRTGLLAGLQTGFLTSAGGHWRVAEFRPGNRPFFRLAEALLAEKALGVEYTAPFSGDIDSFAFLQAQLRRGPYSLHEILTETPLPENTNLLLLVDQFEEIFRYYQQGAADQAAAFVSLLLNSSKHSNIYIVLTMRSDFIGDCALFYDLPEAIDNGLFLTPRLTRDQLREAIEEPALVFGGEIDPTLVNKLLNDMSSDPDQLPLLQHALMRMWTLASNTKYITLEHYKKIGGLTKALSLHADEAYAELTVTEQKTAEFLFRSLCERGSNSRDTRRPVKLKEVATLAHVFNKNVADIVEVFRQSGRTFLTPSLGTPLEAETVLDISHESLIRQWQRLKTWTRKEAEYAELYQRLQDTAIRWQQQRAVLWSGIELELALKWRSDEQPTLIWAQRYGKAQNFDIAMRFLDASALRQQEKQRILEENRLRKLKLALFGLVFALGLAIWGFWERDNAIDAQKIAETARHQAEWTEKSRTISLFESELTHAALLAGSEDYAAATEILTETRELDLQIPVERRNARNLLAWYSKLMGDSPQQRYQVGVPLSVVAISHDGRLLSTGGENGTLALFNRKSGQLLQILRKHEADITAIVFLPKSQWLISAGGEDRKVIFWSLFSGQAVTEWETPAAVWALAASSDGKLLATGGDDKNITLWEVATGKKITTLEGHKERISSLAFSPDDKLLASSAYDNTATIWDLDTGKSLHKLRAHSNHVQKVVWHPNGELVATASSDKSVRLWNVKSGKNVRMLLGHKNKVFGIKFIDNGRYLVSASDDRSLRIWHTKSGVTVRILQGHTSGVINVDSYADKIFSASTDGLVIAWNSDLAPQKMLNLADKPSSTAIAPNGESVAVGFANGKLSLYSLPDTKLLWEKSRHAKKVKRLSFSADSRWLASGSFDKTVKLWEVKTGKQQHSFQHKGAVNAVTFAPNNSQKFASASYSGEVGLFDVNGKSRFFDAQDGYDINVVSYNSNGTRILSTGDRDIRLWALAKNSQKLLQEYPQANDWLMWSELSPNGQQIATVGRDQLVHIYSTQNKSTKYSLVGHESTIYRVIYSADGEQVATVSDDGTLRVWDLYNGSELFKLRLPTIRNGDFVPVWDFDFRCTSKDCWISVPLTSGKLMLYNLGKLEQPIVAAKKTIVTTNEQFIPIPIYRTGSYGAVGELIFGGFMDYMTMLNERDGGINSVKLTWEECETGYRVERAMECYQKLKTKPNAAMFNFLSTSATNAAMKYTKQDKIPIVSIGYGDSKTADGRVFPYMFPLMISYWNQNTAKIKFIAQQEGGVLKGKTIANVYYHRGSGKETIQVLEAQAKKYGFKLKHFPIRRKLGQKATWEQIKRLNPDWILLRGWGVIVPTALKEAQRIGFPIDHIIGLSWNDSESEVIPAGKAANGFITAGYYPDGDKFKVIQDVRPYAKVSQKAIGSINY